MRLPPPDASKFNVFVSYSRTDLDFADQLVAALQAYGITPFIDRSGIHGAEEWQKRLGQLILEADAVVFILTPDSAVSQICKWEVDEALRLSKRIIPIIWRPLGDVRPHEYLRDLNYIYFYADPTMPGSGFGTGLVRLVGALTTDVAWIREHTRLGELTARWERDARPTDLLLRGSELARMRAWREERSVNAPDITALQRTFLDASEDAEAERETAQRKQLEEMRAAQEAREEALKKSEVEQQARAKAQWRNRYLVGAAAVLAVILFAGALWQSRDTERREALVMTSLAHRAMEEGFHERAMRIAIQGLPVRGRLPIFSLGWDTPEMWGLEAKLAGAAQASALRLKLAGHAGPVLNAAFSPDGTRIVTASGDGTARVWDAGSGQELSKLEGRRGQVWSATFSPDGSRIVTASWDRTARVWDAESGQELLKLAGPEMSFRSAVFSPDGAHIVAASLGETARVWDARSGLQLLELEDPWAMTAAFSPDGTRIVTGSQDGMVRLWDARSGQELLKIKGHIDSQNATVQLRSGKNGQVRPEPESGGAWVEGAAFSPDGARVVTCSKDGTTRVWDAQSGQALLKLEGTSITNATFSPDGARLVTGSRDGTVRVWDSKNGQKFLNLEGHGSEITSAAFSPDGARIVTTSEDKTARVWDVSDGQERPEFEGPPAWNTAFSRDGTSLFVVPTPGTKHRWTESVQLQGPVSGIHNAAFSPDGTRIVTDTPDGTAWVWDVRSGQQLLKFEGHGHGITSIAFSPNGSRVVTASWDKTMRVWDVRSGQQLVKLEGHGRVAFGVAFSPDSTRIVASWRDGTVRSRDAAWLVNLRGTELVRRACEEGLISDTKLFAAKDASDPILSGLSGTNPCNRRGPLSLDYWRRLLGRD